MLSLTMPYRLRQGEINNVCNLLNKLIHLVHLEKIHTIPNTQGLFIVNLLEDHQPTYLTLYHGSDFHNCRLLNTGELAIEIQEALNHSDSELIKISSIDLLKRLLSSWSIMSKRNFSRLPKQESHVEVAFGISAAHHYISGQKPFISELKEAADTNLTAEHLSQFESTKINAISDQDVGADMWMNNYTYSTNDPLNAPLDTQLLNNASTHVQSFDYQSARLAISNVSAGGCCLISEGDNNFSAHVGDLLAMREYNDSNIDQWGISVIRRMISLKNGNVELGIEMLTPNAIAVAVQLEANDGSPCSSELMRGLMLPELRTIEQPATIIIPTLPFKKNSRIRIYLQDKEILVTLTLQLEQTKSFSQFEFTIVKEAPLNDASKDGGNTEQNFDSLWSIL